MVRTATPCRPPRPLRRHPRQQHRRRRLRPPRPPQPHPVWTTCSAPSRWTSITRRCKGRPPETGSVFPGGPGPGDGLHPCGCCRPRGEPLQKSASENLRALWTQDRDEPEGALAAIAGLLTANGNALDHPGMETKVPQDFYRGTRRSHQGRRSAANMLYISSPLDPASRRVFFVPAARRVMRGNRRSTRHAQRLHKTTNAGQADTSGRTLPLLQCQICRRV